MRRMAEIKLLEFIVSIKYYMKSKARALTAAMLCNLLSIEDPTIVKNSAANFDIYLQNFFAYVYQLFQPETNALLEIDNDCTFIDSEKVINRLNKGSDDTV
jgi:hypothetical protein